MRKPRIVCVLLFISMVLAFCIVIYVRRETTSFDEIVLQDENGKDDYPIGVDFEKTEKVGEWTYFIYNYTDNVIEEKCTYPVLFKWKKGNYAVRVSELACSDFFVAKDSVFYLNSTIGDLSHGESYVLRPDGKNSKLLKEEVYCFEIEGEYLYYVYCYDTVGVGLDEHAIYRMNLNGTDISKAAYKTYGTSLTAPMKEFEIKDGFICYDDYKIEIGSPATGLEKVIYTKETDSEWLYYTSNKLIKARPDGSEQIVLDDTDTWWISFEKIEDEWIYYTIGNEHYKIDIYGDNKQIVKE